MLNRQVNKQTNKYYLGLIILLIAYTSPLFANEQSHITKSSYSNVDTFSLNIGDTISALSLIDSQGEKHSLRLLANQQNILIVIYRGEWCPFCIDQLESFETILPELKQYNTRLVAISPDNLATNKNTQRKFGLDYLFLSDTEMKLIDELGIRKNEDIPHPATILVGKGGKVLWYFVDKDFKTRPTGKQMRQVLNLYLK